MNRTYFRMVSALVAAAFLFAACTQDEPTNSTDTLPEGMYPLQISGITLEAESSQQPWGADAPQTRVSETNDRNGSVWQDGDKINVQIGDGTPGVYTYTDGKLEVADGDAPAYWASTDNGQTITAWYTSSGSETVDLSNQTSGLAYVLKAQTTANFDEEVSLAFSHALAKVRVVPEGEKKDEVTDVRIKTYTSCTLNTDGTLTAGSKEEFILMVQTTYEDKTCWEANVVPVSGAKIDHIKVNGKECELTNSITPETGKWHKITIDIRQQPIDIGSGSGTIEIGDGEYTIRGNGSEHARPIVVNGNADITFENEVKIKVDDAYDGAVAMKIADGKQVKLTVKGTGHSLVSTSTTGEYGCGIEIGNNAGIEIIGEGSNKSSLTVKAGKRNPGIGPRGYTNSHCNGITIKDIDLTVSAGEPTPGHTSFGAAIGLGITSSVTNYVQSCELICIDNAVITATGRGSGTCIGIGSCNLGELSINKIEIKNSTLSMNVETSIDYGTQGACIGFGTPVSGKGSQSIGSITIENTEFKNCNGNQIIGCGNNPWGFSFTSSINNGNGFTVNGTKCTTYWNNASEYK